MITILERSPLQSLLGLYEVWKSEGDAVYSEKLLDLARKQARGEYLLAFCGHFSAGKSTMMNHLYGSDLLPTSPIPTSANVVRIQRGADRVVLTMQSGGTYAYDGTYSDAELKQLCKNGEEIVGVQLYRCDADLPEGVVLIDTPGIDSTDDAHKLATDSALHLADIIFYMMDYNHVQSEVNLQFVKELKERHKRVYLVINQIDKHREEELSFPAYRESVAASFANWNIAVDGIYYTSLRSKEHAHNELAQLEKLLRHLMQERTAYMEESVRQEVQYLLQEHLDWRQRLREQETEQAARLLQGAPSLDQTETQLAELSRQRQDLQLKEKHIQDVYSSGLTHILDHAYLMPFAVRDAAKMYLETELTSFKVGFFFSKAKTEQEKENRLQAYYSQLQETVETQLDFHVKEYMLKFWKEQGVYTEALGREVYELSVPFERDMLRQLIQRGAGFTGDYVLNYTNDVAQALKKQYRQAAVSFLEKHMSLLQRTWQEELQELSAEMAQYEAYHTAWRQLHAGEQQQQAYALRLESIRQGEELVAVDSAVLAQETAIVHKQPVLLQEEAIAEAVHIAEGTSAASRSVHAITDYMVPAEAAIQRIPVLQHLYAEIAEKRKRLETRQFTVALFGAFSAGKSSFANALLGEKVLPVSPNPTTATINKIMPVTSERSHGTVRIQLKSAATLLADLQQIYHLFERSVSSLEEAVARIEELLRQPAPSGRQKTTFSFLRAVQHGYAGFAEQLGQLVTTDLAEFAEYVANEEKSCFVEYMELYYDCEFTRKGITLVDTPGADSVNARHTDVAFQYIKNADAILFVTYYNHVFSRADREFLIQLGRVKDTFSLDKMFFIINAADLAASQAELQTVRQYISSQLLQYGIRNPRLFPLSSLFALEEKQGRAPAPGQYGILEQSGMAAFMEAFTAFTTHDLLRVSVTALQHVLEGTVQLLAEMIDNATAGNDEREAKRRQYERESKQVQQTIAAYSVLTEEHALQQEIRELLYYVKQRIFLRYQDLFPEIFNPAVLRPDKGDPKLQIRQCTAELLDFMKHDLVQELRATSLRIEKWMNSKLAFSQQELAAQCRVYNDRLSFEEQVHTFSLPAYGEPLPGVDLSLFKKAMGLFKNTKSFFAQNERARMQEEMKQVLEPFVAAYLAQEERSISEYYRALWQESWRGQKGHMEAEAGRYYADVLHVLSEKIDVSLYKDVQHTVQYTVEALQNETRGEQHGRST